MPLRRTLLWVAGSCWDKILEGIGSSADCIVLDLEDLVPKAEKDNARVMVCKALTSLDFKGKEKIVRINPVNSELGKKDIKAIMDARPDAIRLPKCETVDYVLELDQILDMYEKEHGLAKDTMKIILMIESALGVRNAYELATCTSRITAIGLGAEDLTVDLKTSRSTTGIQIELLYARQKLVIDGTAAKVDVIDSSCLSISSLDDLKAETQMIKQMGFIGKSVIHVSQLETINSVFTPSSEEIAKAKEIIQVAKDSETTGVFDVYLDGKLIDTPVVTKAELILMRAKAARVLV